MTIPLWLFIAWVIYTALVSVLVLLLVVMMGGIGLPR